ncbi:MAG: glycosyltransferase, partial [Burkholderiaceae bacterium]|nr:glycosyltransferase [Burkholderiaceae bacterium]
MQIIFVDRRLARARTVDLNTGTLIGVGIVALTAIALAVIGLYVVTFRLAAEVRVPLVRDMIGWVMRDELARNEQFVRDNVSALAKRVGEMQAQLMRLDALGERIAKIAGIRPEEFNFKELPGRGGAAPTGGRPLTLDELQRELERVQPDLVHIHNVSGATLAPHLACQAAGLPVVSTLHDLWLLCPNNM